MMDARWQTLYELLLTDTDRIRSSSLPDQGKTEACFKCCLGYWEKLKTLVLQRGFDDEQEEIGFFKYVKPLFTGQLELYTLVYQFQLFAPTDDGLNAVFYRQRELTKIARFRENYEHFIRYYNSGKKDKDPFFFLRRHYEGELRPYIRVYDQDPGLSSAYDWIVTLMIGNDLYEQYLLD